MLIMYVCVFVLLDKYYINSMYVYISSLTIQIFPVFLTT